MNILFIFIAYPEDKDANFLTKDLPDEFSERGENVYVATIRERSLGLDTAETNEHGKRVLRIKTGNMFNKVSKIEKGLVMLTLNKKILKEIKSKWADVKFDLIVGSSPYTSNYKLIGGLKKYYDCPSFLILWDIFPQNAKDLGLIKNKYLFRYLKNIENKSLIEFDFIGCGSEGNFDYVIKNYPFIDKKKLLLFPLWGQKSDKVNANKIDREDFGFSKKDFILVFGGNMGIPQNLDNILNLAQSVSDIDNIKFLFIGTGTEAKRINSKAKELNLSNTSFINKLERNKYERVMASCDVGLVSLHPDFTVPNFPSKTIDYLKYGLPILASLDATSLNDFGDFIQNKAKVGLSSHAEDMNKYKSNLIKLYKDQSFYRQLSENCYKSYMNDFNINNNYNLIKELI